jgi:hypothetical protein
MLTLMLLHSGPHTKVRVSVGYSFRVIGIMVSAFAVLSVFFRLFFAIAYKIPAKKPTVIAVTDPSVTGSPKKIMPDAATGNLLSAPVMLQFRAVVNCQGLLPKLSITHLYVVLLVTRIHHAVVYEIPTAAAPENAMAKRSMLRVSGGLHRCTREKNVPTVVARWAHTNFGLDC